MNSLLLPAIKLFDRFYFRSKFIIIMMVFLFPMLLIGYLFSTELLRKIATAQLERQGIVYVAPLRQLIEHTAQHRGMTNAYLNGDKSFLPKIAEKARQVNDDFAALHRVDARLGDVLGTANSVDRLREQWQQLARSSRTMPAKESFVSHTELITGVIDYTAIIADKATLSSDPQPDTSTLIKAVIEFIPVVVENMGQARGAGSGVIAAKRITSEKKLHLSLLTDRFSVAAKKLKASLKYAFEVNPYLRQQIGREADAAIAATASFKEAIEREILQADTIQITASHYFSMGSEAINANFVLYDKMLPLIEQMLQEREDEATETGYITGTIFLGVLFFLFYLFMGLYKALERSIDDLLTTTEDLSGGDLTSRLHPTSNDEMAKIAHSINKMAEDMGQSVFAITNSSKYLAELGDTMIEASDQTLRGIHNQVGEINQAATAINQMSATAHEMASTTAHTAKTVGSAKKAAVSGQNVVTETILSINTLADEVGQSANVIRRLEENCNNIGSILGSIQGIAEQTNLLALNAAIEAARAGDQGRGFAVVADEVRTLAQRTQESTQEINEVLNQLQQGTSEAVLVMERSGESAQESVSKAASAGEALQEIIDAVSTIHEMTTHVATAVEEQRAVSDEINRNIVNVNTVAEKTAFDADSSTETSNRVATLGAEVRALLDRFKIDEEVLKERANASNYLMEWDASLNIGIDEIDRQHKLLVAMLNEVSQIFGENGSLKAVQRVLNGLVSYTHTHFRYEEQLLEKHNYPDIVNHKTKHKKLLAKLVTYKNKIDSGDDSISDELLVFLKEWLISHIKGSDMYYAKDLKEKGVR